MPWQMFGSFINRPLLPDLAALSHRPALLRVPAQSLRIAILLVIMAALNLTDLRFTLFAKQNGMLGEVNPIAANFLAAGMESSLIGFKLLCGLIGTAALWRARRSRWTPGVCWVLVLLYFGLAITWLLWTRTFTEIKYAEMALLQSPHRHF